MWESIKSEREKIDHQPAAGENEPRLSLVALHSGDSEVTRPTPDSARTNAAPDPSQVWFESQIKKFVAIDKRDHIASAETVFTGSSTFEKWDIEKEFKSEHALNRAIGGTTYPFIDAHLNDLVLKYHPKTVVIYSGTNDIAAGHSGKQVAADLARVEQDIHKAQPNAELYFVGPNEGPSREQWSSEYATANTLARSYLAARPHSHYIDIRTAMHDQQGHLRRYLFSADQLHMNASGYSVWKPIIMRALHPSSNGTP